MSARVLLDDAAELAATDVDARRAHAGACAVCCGTRTEAVHSLRSVPVQSSRLFRTRAEALAVARGSLDLAVCCDCGFLANGSFEESLVRYDADYEDSQAFSPRFVEYARGLAADLVARHDLRGAHAVDVGCGTADFLTLVCEATGGTGTGYDPAASQGAIAGADDRVRLVTEPFSSTTGPLDAGLVACRHTLEHLARPGELLATIRAALASRPDAVLLLEVPDVTRVLAEDAFWDVYYEHCSYFSPATLGLLTTGAGFEVLATRRAYDDQYLVLEARPSERSPRIDLAEVREAAADLVGAASAFGRRVGRRIADLRTRLDAVAGRGERVALWGAGSKAVGCLTAVGDTGAVDHVVDVNPAKWGTFVPGTGQEIVAPDTLRSLRPDHVWVMNPVYRDEIAAALAALDLHPVLETL